MWRAVQTPVYVLLVGLLFFGGAEITLRSPLISQQLPPPSWGMDYYPFEEQYARFQTFVKQHGRVDCIFLGSSMVLADLAPAAFEAGYAHRSGEPLECFNFGVMILTASSAGPIAEILVKDYHPKLLIFGTALRDYNALTNSNPAEIEFPAAAWVRYKDGDFSPRGWLSDHAALFRYLQAMPDILQPKPYRQAGDHESHFEDGFQPAIHFDRDSPLLWHFFGLYTPPAEVTLALSPQDWAGFQQLVEAAGSGTRLFIVELPTYAGYGNYVTPEGEPITLQDLLGGYANQRGVPVWSNADLPALDDADWINRAHFQLTGAWKFSAWLGEQVGEAVARGVPPEVLTRPPLPDLPYSEPPDLLRRGLNPSVEVAYKLHQFDLLPPDALVFDPSVGLYDLDLARLALGYFISWGQIMEDTKRRAEYFDLRTILDRVQFETDLALTPDQQAALQQWRATKLPRYLHEAGIDYLLFNAFWFGFVAEEEAAILTDPRYYELIKMWQPVPLGEIYWLYRALGDQK